MDWLDIDKRIDHFFAQLDARIDRIEKLINNFHIINDTTFSTDAPKKAEPANEP